jgi:hypothetical protein
MSHDTATLIIIYGQVRTLETTIISIYRNIILENYPCHVVLSVDGGLADVPEKTLKLLQPYLMDMYFTNLKLEDDVPRDHHRIEFTLVKNALDRLTIHQKEDYRFLLKIRTDMHIKTPLCLKNIYGLQSFESFKKQWTDFITHDNIPRTLFDQLQAWFLTGGGLSFFTTKYQRDHTPTSPWSLSDTRKLNKRLWQSIAEKLGDGKDPSLFQIHYMIRQLHHDLRVAYLIGSTWIHFGYFSHLFDISQNLAVKYGTMHWPNCRDEDILEWTDHKGTKRTKPQKEWRWITDDQIRLSHTNFNYCLIDLVNPADYIESFDSRHLLSDNIKNPELFAFIVRPHSIPKKK